MKQALIITGLCFAGCFRPAEEVLRDDPRNWDVRDAWTVVINDVDDNLRRQDENFLVIVTPFTPRVVTALARIQQIKKKFDDREAKEYLDNLLKDGIGLYIDEDGQLWNSRGNRVRGAGDIDSLLIRIVLINRTYPCDPPTINGVPIMAIQDVPCEMPDISDIENRIVLENAAGEILPAGFVVGRNGSILMAEERLFVRFRFIDKRRFLEAGDVRLKILGWVHPLEFRLPENIFGLR